MSLGSELAAVAARVSSPSFPLASEEAVKQSLVLPALSALGYDTVGLSDITPEYPVGGGRVDYALLSGGSPVVLVECKRELGSGGTGQLRGYMSAAGVDVGVLTDGVVWEFYGGVGGPFFIFDIRAITAAAESAFAGFSAGRDVGAAMSAARGVGSLVRLAEKSEEWRNYLGEAVLVAVRCVIAGAGGDSSAVRPETYPVSATINIFYYAGDGKLGNRKRLVGIDFWKNGPVYLSLYGPGGNQDLVDRVRLRAVSDIAEYAEGIRAAAFRGCGNV